jgi:hypothetical protein
LKVRNLNTTENVLVDGRVGIGTTSPAYKLDVVGNTRFVGGVGIGTNPSWGLDVEGRIGVQGISFTFPGTTSIEIDEPGYQVGDITKLQFDFGNTERANIRAGITSGGSSSPVDIIFSSYTGSVLTDKMMIQGNMGNIGIGTMTPNYKLDVAGAANAQQLCIAGDCKSSWTAVTSGTSGWAVSGNSVYNSTTGVNVGIGTNGPGEKLDVQGNLRTSGLIYSTYEGYAQTYLRSWGLSGAGTIYIEPAAGNNLYLTDSWSKTGTLDFQFGKYTFQGGNVGIGTTSPAYKLDVSGAMRLQLSSAPTGANGVMYYDSTSNKFRCYENSAWKDCIGAGIGGSGIDNYIPRWSSEISGLENSVIYQTDGGNVGIGTTTPAYKLDVAGQARIQNDLYLNKPLIFAGSNWAENTIRFGSGAGTNAAGFFGPNDPTYNGMVFQMYQQSPTDKPDVVQLWINETGQNDVDVFYIERVNTWSRVFGVRGNGDIWLANNSKIGMNGDVSSEPRSIKLRSNLNDEWNAGTIAYRPSWDTSVLAIVGANNTPTGDRRVRIYDKLCLGTDCRDTWPSGGGGNGWIVGTYVYNDTTNARVGIGTATPGGTLDVNGRAGATSLKVSSTFGDLVNNAPWYGIGQSSLSIWAGQPTYYATQIAGYYGLNFQTGNGQMVIRGDNGNVGIATTTPRGRLDVAPSTSEGSIWGVDSIIGYNDLRLWGDNTGSDSTKMIYLSSAGNVGIGTNAPGYKLDVNGAMRLQSSSAPTVAKGVIYFDSGANKFKCSEDGTSWKDCIGAGIGGSGIDNYIPRWSSEISGLENSVIYQTDAGNVGIGTTGPISKLNVVTSAAAADNWGVRSYTTGAGGSNNGFFGEAVGGSASYGVRTYASGASGLNYGINAYAGGDTGTKYGVAGFANGAGNNYALYGSAQLGTTNWGLYVASGDTRLATSSGSALDCSGLTNGGKLTTDSTGKVICNNDVSGGGGGGNGWSVGTYVYNDTTNARVGIGTSTPSGKLTVTGSSGDARSVTIDNREIKFRGDGVAHFSIFGPDTGKSYLTIQNTGNNYLPGTAGTDLLTITSTGNVGIGTTSPTAPLSANVGSLGGTNSAVAASLETTSQSACGNEVRLRFYNTGGYEEGTIGASCDPNYGGFGSGGNGYLAFRTLRNGASAEKVRIDATGNVGIGTTSPDEKLDVVGRIVFGDADAEKAKLFRDTGWLHIQNLADTYDISLDGPLHVRTGGPSDTSDEMTVDSAGNVIVGRNVYPVSWCNGDVGTQSNTFYSIWSVRQNFETWDGSSWTQVDALNSGLEYKWFGGNPGFRLRPDRLEWSDRAASPSWDTNLYRSAANTLRTDDSLDVGGGWIRNQGSDFMLGTNDGRSVGSKTTQRALVHDNGDVLVVNYDGDFEGGTRMDGNLNVGGKTNIVNPLTDYEFWSFTDWNDAGDCFDFTPAQAASYSSMHVLVRLDFQSDISTVAFYTGAGCTGTKIPGNMDLQVGHQGSVQCGCGLGTCQYYTPAYTSVVLPTTVKSAKIIARGGCAYDSEVAQNVVIDAYYR